MVRVEGCESYNSGAGTHVYDQNEMTDFRSCRLANAMSAVIDLPLRSRILAQLW